MGKNTQGYKHNARVKAERSPEMNWATISEMEVNRQTNKPIDRNGRTRQTKR